MNQQQLQQMCQAAEKSELYNDMEAYQKMVKLSEEQAKMINPLSPNFELIFAANAAHRSAEMTEDLLLIVGANNDEDQEEEQE